MMYTRDGVKPLKAYKTWDFIDTIQYNTIQMWFI